MKKVSGSPLPLGVTYKNGRANFAMEVPEGKTCKLLLYRKGEASLLASYVFSDRIGSVCYMAVDGLKEEAYEYNYDIDGERVTDSYAKALSGKEVWFKNIEISEKSKENVRGIFYEDHYDWEADQSPRIQEEELIAYAIHVRGFTKDTHSKVKNKGTFQGIIEKIPYLKDLGINQIQCMPVYEFEEAGVRVNYWGYGPGYYFAPKSAYAKDGDGVKGLKDLVKYCHKAGIEVVLEMPFAEGISGLMVTDCLRNYVMEYHVDGFILNPYNVPMDIILKDPILTGVRILKHAEEYQNVMRRFLKGDEGVVTDVMYQTRKRWDLEGIYNCITTHTGFTLKDLVSYDGKHNEANGENNQDGPDYNYSWNCGAEGPSRKKAVMELRNHQIFNAFFLLFLAQGTPCMLAGDEFGNSQKGNNNVYCQDNPIGWTDWRGLEKKKELHDFVKELIAFRKSHPILTPERELQGIDLSCCGVPDVSYHGEEAWQIPGEVSSRQLGVYYSGAQTKSEDCYVAYNMHWLEHVFALPALPKGYGWYVKATTERGMLDVPVLLKDQRKLELKERSVTVLTAERIVEVETKKNENITTLTDDQSS